MRRDIWRTAQAMVKQHGDNAKMQAGFRSDACLEKATPKAQRYGGG